MPATYEDAKLVIQLARWGTEMGLDDAVRAIFASDFDPQSASADDPDVRKMLAFGEMVGTLTKQRVLDRDLVLDMWWIQGMWSRVGPAAHRRRDEMGESRLFENFEALARP
jgi:hypothetical protein